MTAKRTNRRKKQLLHAQPTLQAASQSEGRYRSLFDHMLDGFAYCQMLFDAAGRPIDFIYLDVNAAFETLTGLKDVTGKKVTEVVPGIREQHPELFEVYGRVARTGQPERFVLDFKPLAIWLSLSVYSPAFGYFVAVFDNITERKHAEESLQEAMHRIETLNRTLEQRAEALELANEELRVTNEDLEKEIGTRTRAEEEREHLHQDFERRAVDLEATNKELEAFTYSVSHDLRGPLNLIEQMSRLVIAEYAAQLPDHGQHLLQLIHENSTSVNALADDLLTLTRMQQQTITRRVVAMSDLVREVVDEFMPVRDRQVEISIGDLPPALGDPLHLKQVWRNLISNALKFTRPCPRARIEIGSLNLEDGRSKMEAGDHSPTSNLQSPVYYIKDNGVGFNMAQSDRLFHAFQRLHHAEDFAGNGLGLAIVERVVCRHGGRAWAQAHADGGATFFFMLGG